MTERSDNTPVNPTLEPGTDSPADTIDRQRRWLTPSERVHQEERSHRLILLATRLVFMVLLVTVTLLPFVGRITETNNEVMRISNFLPTLIVMVGWGVLVLIIDAYTPKKSLATLFGVYLGVLFGLIGALGIGFVVDLVAESWDLVGEETTSAYVSLIKAGIAVTLCYLAVTIVLTTKDDFRLVIPYVEFAKQVRGVRPLLLDTSVLVDGRIEQLGATGFLDAPLVIPQFVIDELQQLADSSDKLKRARGRRGLNVVSKLQENPAVDISIDPAEATGHSVDHMLLHLAANQNLRILTTDYNLIKVAKIQGVDILNINDLANTLKPQVIPGEHLTVDITRRGESASQGVGYMPDGTMVVVEDAAEFIGRSVELVVTNSLQTTAGRMIFGRMIAGSEGEPERQDEEQFEVHDHQPDAHEPKSDHLAKAATDQPRTTSRPAKRADANPRRNPRR